MKKTNETLRSYYNRLNMEAIIKSLMIGLTTGFFAAFISAAITWFFIFNGLWLSIGLFALVSIAVGLTTYFKYLKPNIEDLARRIDEQGFEERMITMLEFEGVDSPITNIQRDDTKIKLKDIRPKAVGFRVPKLLIALLSITLILGIAMVTVTGLSNAKALPTGDEFFEDLFHKDKYYTVTFLISNPDGGEILGEAEQVVIEGGSTTEVYIMCYDGYGFSMWKELNIQEPNLIIDNVEEDMVITAIIGEAMGGGDGGQQGSGNGESDTPPKLDSESGDSGSGGGGGGNNPSNGAGGQYKTDNDTIIDGKYYYDNIEEYYYYAMELLREGKEIPDYLKEIVEKYFDTIR